MALFVWKCELCGRITRKLLPKRPELGSCRECDGKLKFSSNVSSQTMEVIDNGLMARVLERPAGIEEKIAERNALAEKPDDEII